MNGALYGLVILLAVLMAAGPGLALTPFEQQFLKSVADKALDRFEYNALKALSLRVQPGEEAQIAQGILNLLAQHRTLVRINLSRLSRPGLNNADFLFSPTHAENEEVLGNNPPQLLGRISQADLLTETVGDNSRCGASALLAGHYLLYGNFRRAFQRLGIPNGKLTYRQIHLAQEKLYKLSNSDGEDGLTQYMLFQVKGYRVNLLRHEGEVIKAAQQIGLQVTPLKVTVRDDLPMREQIIRRLWAQKPNLPLLVGVYLDSETGQIFPPNDSDRIQNHFVLVFRQNARVWLYNSGVADNGLQSAVRLLDNDSLRAFVMQSSGSINSLTIKY